MSAKTPTLPTVIITPSTPLYLLPTRQYRPMTFDDPYASSPTPSSSRQYTRKQHLMSALELGPPLFPRPADTDKEALLLSPPLHVPHVQSRRQPTIWLSLAVFALFGLILVGPMLPYRWWTGTPAAGVAELQAPIGGAGDDMVPPLMEDITSEGLRRRWQAYGPGQGSDPRYAHAFGPGQAAVRREELESQQSIETGLGTESSDGEDLD